MDERIKKWLAYVTPQFELESREDFAGLGLIFYHQPLTLPICDLAADAHFDFVPTKSPAEAVALLKTVSRFDSPYHDGFHLVDSATLSITHVSQFFAPPILKGAPKVDMHHPIGARFMAAYLGSFLPQIELIATLSKREGGLIFQNGTIIKIHPAKEEKSNVQHRDQARST